LLVINLERRPERLERFVEAVADHKGSAGVEPCRIAAMDGKLLMDDLPTTLIQPSLWEKARSGERSNDPWWATLTRGGVGLTLSHARAWLHIIENDLPMALVAEDDLRFYVDDFGEQLHTMCGEALRQEMDMVQLQSCWTGWPKPGDKVSTNDFRLTSKDIVALRDNSSKTTLYKWADWHGSYGHPCTSFYLLTNKGARAALRATLPMSGQLDDQQGKGLLHALHGGVVVPPIAQSDERGGSTDVQPAHEPMQDAYALKANGVPQGLQAKTVAAMQVPTPRMADCESKVGANSGASGGTLLLMGMLDCWMGREQGFGAVLTNNTGAGCPVM
jgi:GR25 family glycosyltransferase involved in LPS biosynthesis